MAYTTWRLIFSLFDSGKESPATYGDEFVEKYNLYHGVGNNKGDKNLRWQELDSTKNYGNKSKSRFVL